MFSTFNFVPEQTIISKILNYVRNRDNREIQKVLFFKTRLGKT